MDRAGPPIPNAVDVAAPTTVQVLASLTIGACGLMITGLSPVIMGSLQRSGQLSRGEMGLTAMAELLAMGLTAGVAGGLLKPERMRLIAIAAGLGAAAADIFSPLLAHGALIGLRAVAGVAEGLMLWIAIALIARQATPERSAGLFLTAQVIGAFFLTGLCANLIGPKFGISGIFAAVGATGLLAALAAPLSPNRLATPVSSGEASPFGLPPARGWVSLLAMFAFVAAGSGVYVYLEPIAGLMGLGPGAVAAAVQVNLVAQILGGAAATMLAGRVRYSRIFMFSGALAVCVYGVYLAGANGLGFVLATGCTGFAGMLLTPFFVPLSLDADPARRAASMAGGAQLLGGAAGPLAASGVATRPDTVIMLSIGWVVISVTIALALAATRRIREPVMVPVGEP